MRHNREVAVLALFLLSCRVVCIKGIRHTQSERKRAQLREGEWRLGKLCFVFASLCFASVTKEMKEMNEVNGRADPKLCREPVSKRDSERVRERKRRTGVDKSLSQSHSASLILICVFSFAFCCCLCRRLISFNEY